MSATATATLQTSGKRAIRLVGKVVDNLRSSSSSSSSSPQGGASSSEVDDDAIGNEGMHVDGDDDDDEEGDFYLNTHMHVKSKSGKVHSTTSITQSPKFFLNKHSNKVMSLVSFQHLGQTVLVSASLDGTIRAWTLNTAYRPKEHTKQQSPMECSISIIGELLYHTLPYSNLSYPTIPCYGLPLTLLTSPSSSSSPSSLSSTSSHPPFYPPLSSHHRWRVLRRRLLMPLRACDVIIII